MPRHTSRAGELPLQCRRAASAPNPLGGRELARWRGWAVGGGARGAPRFPAGVVLLRVHGRFSAPFPAPARQSVHAVLPHTAYRRRLPAAFGLSRQGLPALGETTIP